MEILKTVSPKDLLTVLKKGIIVVAVCAVLCPALLWAGFALAGERYESTAVMYILPVDKAGAEGFSISLSAMADCAYFLESDSLYAAAAAESGGEGAKLFVTNPEGTRVLELRVLASTPEKARSMAESLGRLGCEKINSAVGFGLASLAEEASDPVLSTPLNMLTVLISAVFGGGAAYFVLVLRYCCKKKTVSL